MTMLTIAVMVVMKTALDLFCCAGGASEGLARAGFQVWGVDREPQPDYRFPERFQCLDVLEMNPEWIAQFDLVWASPPCQSFTAYRRKDPKKIGASALNLIPQTRALLAKVRAHNPRVLTIIENVEGAPLENPTTLCGSMFGLDVRRHRLFETSYPVPALECRHPADPRFPPASNRTNLRSTVEVGVYRIPLAVQRAAMGIDWMPLDRLSQAIPPAYSEYLGSAALARMVP